ncbi:MAG TPA: AraC family transcriptional regulator [Bacillota bacterium]|nr:AraC family transcriptional regulator [Bacillota bacterium]
MELKERISYLQGLADGLDINADSKEGRLIREMLDVLDDMADTIVDLEARQEELEEYTETISEDLSDLEDEVYEECDDDECTCGHEDGFIDVECPKCHEIVCFEEDILDDEEVAEVTCPNCGEVVFVNDGEFLEIDEDEDEE